MVAEEKLVVEKGDSSGISYKLSDLLIVFHSDDMIQRILHILTVKHARNVVSGKFPVCDTVCQHLMEDFWNRFSMLVKKNVFNQCSGA